MVNHIFTAALLSLLISPAAAQTGGMPSEAARARPVVTEIIADDPLETRPVPGVIAARTEVSLGFQTLGRMIARHVDVGDIVTEGQVLAAIDPDDLQDNVTAAEAAVAAALVQLDTTQASAERTRELARRSVVSTAQLEQVENALAAAQAHYIQAQSELLRARDAEGFANLVAPFDGVISAVFVNVGAVVSAGAPVIRLSGDDELEAVIDLPEAALADVSPGQSYEIWSENDEGRHIPAKVRLIVPLADAATRTRRVHLSLAQDQGLRLGTLIRARPALSGQRLLTLPESAIRETDGQTHVWIVKDDDGGRRVHLQAVQTAPVAAVGRIAITAGLDQGDEVVIRGVNSLTDGQAVGMAVTP